MNRINKLVDITTGHFMMLTGFIKIYVGFAKKSSFCLTLLNTYKISMVDILRDFIVIRRDSDNLIIPVRVTLYVFFNKQK